MNEAVSAIKRDERKTELLSTQLEELGDRLCAAGAGLELELDRLLGAEPEDSSSGKTEQGQPNQMFGTLFMQISMLHAAASRIDRSLYRLRGL